MSAFLSFLQTVALPTAKNLDFDPFDPTQVEISEGKITLKKEGRDLEIIEAGSEAECSGFYAECREESLTFRKSGTDHKHTIQPEDPILKELWSSKSEKTLGELDEFIASGSWSDEITDYLTEQFEDPSSEFMNFLSQSIRGKEVDEDQAKNKTIIKEGIESFIQENRPKSWKEQVMEEIQDIFSDHPEILERLAPRVNLSYTNVLLDGNNRKPFFRLHNKKGEKMSVGILENTKELKKELLPNGLSDLKLYKDEFLVQYEKIG